MTDIPGLFQAPMVQAMLQDRKTNTRRDLYRLREAKLARYVPVMPATATYLEGHRPPVAPRLGTYWTLSPWHRVKAGDRIWVRETWRVSKRWDATKPVDLDWHRGLTTAFAAGGSRAKCTRTSGVFGYENDDLYPDPASPLPPWFGKLRPAIHLPRALSRLTLIVTGTKIERLQDISEDDAIAEGVDRHNHSTKWPDGDPGYIHDVARRNFCQLWRTINGPESWARNPWVVAVAFRVVKANIDAPEALAA